MIFKLVEKKVKVKLVDMIAQILEAVRLLYFIICLTLTFTEFISMFKKPILLDNFFNKLNFFI